MGDNLLYKACADKLKMEMSDYGFPPVFPKEVKEEKPQDSEPVIKDPAKGKKVSKILLSCIHYNI